MTSPGEVYPTEQNNLLITAWSLDPADHEFGDQVTSLIEAERAVPVQVDLDRSLRPKIIDACGLACGFCHNEGTPVAVDTPTPVSISSRPGRSGRVSVFADTNGVDFIPGKMMPDQDFATSLGLLRDGLGLSELHLTGGEPTLHTELPGLIATARAEGYSVRMTSNGERGAAVIPEAAAAGLDKINFSIFGTTPEELADVQHEKYKNIALAQKKIDALHDSITTAVENGVGVAANIVMSDSTHEDRVRRLIDTFDSRLSVRILPDLDKGPESYYAIYNLLAKLGAVPTKAFIDAGSSNARVGYELPNGRTVFFKQIRPARLAETCDDCAFNNGADCKEGFYGVRLYRDKEGVYRVGVCIQRMDLTSPIEEFMRSNLYNEVQEMRLRDLADLQSFYSERK